MHQVAVSAHGQTIGLYPSIEEDEQIGDRTTDRHVAGARCPLHLYAVRREFYQPLACSIGTVEAVALTAVGRKRALGVASRIDHLDDGVEVLVDPVAGDLVVHWLGAALCCLGIPPVHGGLMGDA